MGYDLSVIIPARNEEWLARTVQSIQQAKRGATEIIVILDGAPADPPIESLKDVTIIHHSKSVGQRAAINEGARISRAKYVMKLDAHCALDEGFDVKLMAQCEPDWTVVPRLYNLHVFDWVCTHCDNHTYQGPQPEHCLNCKAKDFKRVVIWKPKRTKIDSMRFNYNLEFKYWGAYSQQQSGNITDTMSLLGACFFMHRDRYWELGGSDEKYGSWGQQGTEIACKSWLSGGRLVCNKTTWYSHLFRTQPGFGFPYPNAGKERAMARCRELWFNNKWNKQVRPLSWIIDHFAPIPNWHQPERERGETDKAFNERDKQRVKVLEQVLEAGERFYRERGLTPHEHRTGIAAPLSKGVVYTADYDDPQRESLLTSLNGHEIASVTTFPVDFGRNTVLNGNENERILTGLNELTSDVALITRAGEQYSPEYFAFTPARADTVYKRNQTLCGYRTTLIDWYRRSLAKEPTNLRIERCQVSNS